MQGSGALYANCGSHREVFTIRFEQFGQWLSTLGTIQVNWKLLVMKISMGDRTVTLKGEEGSSPWYP